jgi:hypothetical protein
MAQGLPNWSGLMIVLLCFAAIPPIFISIFILLAAFK